MIMGGDKALAAVWLQHSRHQRLQCTASYTAAIPQLQVINSVHRVRKACTPPHRSYRRVGCIVCTSMPGGWPPALWAALVKLPTVLVPHTRPCCSTQHTLRCTLPSPTAARVQGKAATAPSERTTFHNFFTAQHASAAAAPPKQRALCSAYITPAACSSHEPAESHEHIHNTVDPESTPACLYCSFLM